MVYVVASAVAVLGWIVGVAVGHVLANRAARERRYRRQATERMLGKAVCDE
jgi:hypothetical protein